MNKIENFRNRLSILSDFDTINIVFYTEEYLYDSFINNIKKIIGLSEYDCTHAIRNVKSANNSAFIDCIVEVEINDEIVYGLGVEITQTTDKSSRNSSVYQRPAKFIQFMHYYPDYDCLMYYTEEFHISTDTSRCGFSLLHLMGIPTYNVTGDYPKTIEEFVILKNKAAMRGPKHNIPLTVSITKSAILVSARLEKGGNFTHDPNIGFVSTICYIMKDCGLPIRIHNHGLSKNIVRKTKNKLYQNLSIIGGSIEFDFEDETIKWDCSISDYKNNKNYFLIKEDGEKVSMIKFCKYLEKRNINIVFKNIAGCEREKMCYFHNKMEVPKKTKIPDVVYINSNKQLVMVEGECDYNLKKGIKQLDTFDEFEKLAINFLIENGVDINKKALKGVITDKPVSSDSDFYWGHFLTSNDNGVEKNDFLH